MKIAITSLGRAAVASGLAARLLADATAVRDRGCYPEAAAEAGDGCFPRPDAPRDGCFPAPARSPVRR